MIPNVVEEELMKTCGVHCQSLLNVHKKKEVADHALKDELTKLALRQLPKRDVLVFVTGKMQSMW